MYFIHHLLLQHPLILQLVRFVWICIQNVMLVLSEPSIIRLLFPLLFSLCFSLTWLFLYLIVCDYAFDKWSTCCVLDSIEVLVYIFFFILYYLFTIFGHTSHQTTVKSRYAQHNFMLYIFNVQKQFEISNFLYVKQKPPCSYHRQLQTLRYLTNFVTLHFLSLAITGSLSYFLEVWLSNRLRDYALMSIPIKSSK